LLEKDEGYGIGSEGKVTLYLQVWSETKFVDAATRLAIQSLANRKRLQRLPRKFCSDPIGLRQSHTALYSVATDSSDLADCLVSHATIWRNGELIDLGTIPGGSGGTSWISDTGLISGLAFNGLIDPVTGQPELEAVLWKNGGPLNLGTANLEASHRSSARFSNCDCHVKSL
jgi:hypothetical protein